MTNLLILHRIGSWLERCGNQIAHRPFAAWTVVLGVITSLCFWTASNMVSIKACISWLVFGSIFALTMLIVALRGIWLAEERRINEKRWDNAVITSSYGNPFAARPK